MTIDLEELAAVVRLLKDADFSDFHYVRGETELRVRRGDLLAETATPPARAVTSPAAAVVPPKGASVYHGARQGETAQNGAGQNGTNNHVSGAGPTGLGADGQQVSAPLLGTFYSAPKPGEAPFVNIGDHVGPDTVVCIVEVMKLMNSVTAGVSGVVTAVHARDGDLVEHGQALFTIAAAG